MSMENIEHVVVLMLENRSFDSLLGWLYEHDAPAANIPPAAPGDLFRGLQSVDLDKFINTALNGTLSAKPTRGVQGFTVPDVDPGEEFAHVNTQFYGTPAPAPGAPITMTGVLADFVEVLQERKTSEADIRRLAKMCLETFTPGQLPVLNQLAKHYAVSDDWFASVPSQTNPNRAFLMCGTSNGMVNNGDLEDHKANPQAAGLEKVLGMMIGDDRVDAPTIFNALNDAGIDWTVFWQTSYLPHKIATLLTGLPLLIPLLAPFPVAAALATGVWLMLKPYADYLKELSSGDLTSCYTWRLFPQIRSKIPNAAQHFQKLEDFHRLARSGQLPKFSYIEPFWSISHTTNPGLEQLFSALGNDYHPPCNILVGEAFVKEVYTSLIANREAWCKTLLIITFDEFVGTFDHVTDPLKPGVVTPPWGPRGRPPFKSPTKFKFDRLGARVPTILVSPYVQKSTVFRSTTSVPYDHTSVIATTLKWLGQSNRLATFGARTTAAPTFEQVLTLNQPRTDEMDLSFLDAPRRIGDPVRYGDSFVLKNQNGDYLSAFSSTMKAVGGGSVIPDSVMGICVDLKIAAYFPTLGGDQKATLSFVTQAPDPAAQIDHNSQVMLVSREPGLSALNILGAWADSHDCYYADEYLDGDDATKEKWILRKLDNSGQPLRYGDRIYLVNSFYQGQRLTRDTRPFQGKWITTDAKGDYWTLEPVHNHVDRSVKAFQALDANTVLVLGTDNNLWLEHGPFGTPPPRREHVDRRVKAFQALDANTVLVLGSDNNLWLERGPFGAPPPRREHVDRSVQTFQALDANTVLVLGHDDNLWLEHGPFGAVPPKREQVDRSVKAFQALDANTVLVLGNDNNLWLEHGPFGAPPPKREQVDRSVQAFQALDANTVLVLGIDNNLWLAHGPFGAPPPRREQVDRSVKAFQALNPDTVLVLGIDNNLWLEHGPFGAPPPRRDHVDTSVQAFQAPDANTVLVLGNDSNLWLEYL